MQRCIFPPQYIFWVRFLPPIIEGNHNNEFDCMAFTITFEVIARLAYTVICMWEVIRCEHFHSVISLEFRHITASGFRIRTSNCSSGVSCASEIGCVSCVIVMLSDLLREAEVNRFLVSSISWSSNGNNSSSSNSSSSSCCCCYENIAGNVQIGSGVGGAQLQDVLKQAWRQNEDWWKIRKKICKFLTFTFNPKLDTGLIFSSAEVETYFASTMQRE